MSRVWAGPTASFGFWLLVARLVWSFCLAAYCENKILARAICRSGEHLGARVDGGLRTSQGRLSSMLRDKLAGQFRPRQLLILLLFSPVAAGCCLWGCCFLRESRRVADAYPSAPAGLVSLPLSLIMLWGSYEMLFACPTLPRSIPRPRSSRVGPRAEQMRTRS